MARWFVDRHPQRGIPSVSLRRLLPEARFVGCPDWEVSGCTDDHRRLDPGQLFVAIRDPRYDGQSFVREALDRGAAGVIVEQPCPEAGRLQVIVSDAKAAHARICQALAGDPSRRLTTVGVTGTFGSTVTSILIRSILEAAGLRCGLIGAMGWSDGRSTRHLGAGIGHPANPWPGGAAGLASILSYMVDQNCAAGVIEVAGQAMRTRCFEGVSFEAAVVTDVGVPYGLPTDIAHQNRQAKAKLVRRITPGGAAVVNADDPHAELLGSINLDARRVSFGLEHPHQVDISGRIERFDASGTRFELLGFDRAVTVDLHLLGPRQVSHALAAAALAWVLGIDRDAVVAGLETVTNITGHLEAVDEGQDFDVRIDAAQTAEPLTQALQALRAVSAGQVHCVLSAEGNQESQTVRAIAQAAEQGADQVVITLGNPRSGDPNELLGKLLGGFRSPGKVRVEPDRKKAIETALSEACRW